MDISKLIPFIKEAVMTVSPEEVAAQLKKQQQTRQEDRQRETVDNEIIEQDERPSDDLQNEEGQMLEASFKELEIEEAIEQAKEEKKLQSGNEGETNPGAGVKLASYWDMLKHRIR